MFDSTRRGVPSERGSDFCRICTAFRPMTFEHLPPQSAGNTAPVTVGSLEKWVAQPGHVDERRLKGRQQQRGSGGYVLCERCNTTTGRLWVLEYMRWATTALHILRESKVYDAVPPPGLYPILSYTLYDVRPGAFARQVLSMLLSVSGGPETSANNPAAARILLEGSRELPGSLRMFMTLYTGPFIRTTPITGTLNLASGTHQVAVECAFPPFSFVGVVAGEPSPNLGFEITDWTEIGPTETANFAFRSTVGGGHTPFLADYRPLDEIKRQADRADYIRR